MGPSTCGCDLVPMRGAYCPRCGQERWYWILLVIHVVLFAIALKMPPNLRDCFRDWSKRGKGTQAASATSPFFTSSRNLKPFRTSMSGGQAWWDQICEWIEECDIFVFALDENSLDSNACEIEWGYTDKLGKPILPVKISKNVSTTLIH